MEAETLRASRRRVEDDGDCVVINNNRRDTRRQVVHYHHDAASLQTQVVLSRRLQTSGPVPASCRSPPTKAACVEAKPLPLINDRLFAHTGHAGGG